MRVRPVLLVWHRWFGLLAALWLTLLALTGSILVFYDELDTGLNPEQRIAGASGEPAPLAAVIDAAVATRPGTYASFVDLANRPEETTRVFLADRVDSPAPLEHETHVFVDPVSAEVTGIREMIPLGLDRHHLMDFIYGLHVDLHFGGAAVWLIGLLSVLWAIDHFAGAVLSFPNLRRWTQSFSVPRSARGHRLAFTLHRASGLWLFPVTLMLAVSGAYFNWYDQFVHAVGIFSETTPRLSWTLPDLPAPRYDMEVSVDAAIAAARAAGGGEEVDMIAINADKGLYEARVYDSRDIDPYGRRFVTIDGRTGAVLGDRHVTEGSAADVFFAWQYPLHSGKAFGWPGRIVIFLSGLGVAVLSVTGVIHWARKRKVRSLRDEEPAVA